MADLAFDFICSRDPARRLSPGHFPRPTFQPVTRLQLVLSHPFCRGAFSVEDIPETECHDGVFGWSCGCSCGIVGDRYVFDTFDDVKERIVVPFGRKSLASAFPEVSCV